MSPTGCRGTATILFSNTTGNIVIEGNRVLGSPQVRDPVS